MDFRLAEKYSVIVIPEGSSHIRRWEVTKRRIYSGLSGFLSFAFIFVLTFYGFVHYRHQFVTTENLRAENLRFKAERSLFLSKLDTLERTMTRAKLFASRLAAVAGLQEEGIKVGLGPLADADMPYESEENLDRIDVAANMPELESNSSFIQSLNSKLEKIGEQAVDVSEQLTSAMKIHEKNIFFWSSVPSIWPTRGWVTSGFGVRSSPMVGSRRMHSGLDIACPPGTKVIAPGDGIVTYSGWRGGYGHVIIVDHGYGIASMYGHNQGNLVFPGDRIKRGQVIAYTGNSGSSTGPHLHYEVQVDGVPVDPQRYILEDM